MVGEIDAHRISYASDRIGNLFPKARSHAHGYGWTRGTWEKISICF